jgi:hypothetical protein
MIVNLFDVDDYNRDYDYDYDYDQSINQSLLIQLPVPATFTVTVIKIYCLFTKRIYITNIIKMTNFKI